MKKTYVITHDGKTAWKWDKPSLRIPLDDADDWKAKMEAAGRTVVDDRGQPCGNVWD